MKYRIGLCLLFAVLPASLYAQSFPDEMRLSDDGRMLITGGTTAEGLYDQSIIRTIYLDFAQEDFWQQLTDNYGTDVEVPATMTVEDDVFENVGVQFKGLTSYRRIRGSDKKSFNISLEYDGGNQELMGYETLNLHNGAEDPTFIREVLYRQSIRYHIPAVKGNYVKLVINGEDWGIYSNIQQLNSDFIREWFMSSDGSRWRAIIPDSSGGRGHFGDGTAALNYLSPDTTAYQQYYTLKKAHKQNPWDDLVLTANVLENTPLDQLETTLAPYLDIDRTLWHLATEILFADDDSYVFKGAMDYFLYWEAETDRITLLEYDGNSIMTGRRARSWGAFYNADDENYPLLNRLLAVPSLRQRYLAHLRTLMDEVFDPGEVSALIDHYAALIDADVAADPKKLFTYNDFLAGIDTLKQVFIDRRDLLLSDAEVNQIGPAISEVVMAASGADWARPAPGETVSVRATVSGGVQAVRLYYTPTVVGNFETEAMFDDGAHDDGAAGDGVYGASIPSHGAGAWVRFYIEALANDAPGTVSYFPQGAEHDVFIYQVDVAQASTPSLVINEFMASNQNAVTDEAGDYEDWIELFNLTGEAVNLVGYYLTDNPANLTKWSFPAGTTLPANGYLIIWADDDTDEGDLHANFRLSRSGETITLLNPNLEIVDEVTYTDQVTDRSSSRVPNGTGDFVIQPSTFGQNNDDASTAIEDSEVPQPERLSLYPNPATSTLTISLESNNNLESETLLIFNTLGQRVWKQEFQSYSEVDIAHFPSGLYLVKCGPFSKTFVVVN